jgi:hypothetical protein
MFELLFYFKKSVHIYPVANSNHPKWMAVWHWQFQQQSGSKHMLQL